MFDGVPTLSVIVGMSNEQEQQRILQEIAELRERIARSTRELNAAQTTVETKQKALKKNEYTAKELESLPDNTRTYKAVGRMFLLSPIASLRADLSAQSKALDTDVTALVSRIKLLEKEVKDGQTNLKEVIDGAKRL